MNYKGVFWLSIVSEVKELVIDPVLFNDENVSMSNAVSSRDAAVLVLIVGCDVDNAAVLMTKRPDNMRINPGDMCFPGGKQDDGDDGLIGTALRESWEEVGLSDDVRIIGSLGRKITRETGRFLTPIVAYSDSEVNTFVNSPSEVEEIVWVRLKDLISCRFSGVLSNGLVAPCFDYEGRIFRGVSAEILNYIIESFYDVEKFS